MDAHDATFVNTPARQQSGLAQRKPLVRHYYVNVYAPSRHQSNATQHEYCTLPAHASSPPCLSTLAGQGGSAPSVHTVDPRRPLTPPTHAVTLSQSTPLAVHPTPSGRGISPRVTLSAHAVTQSAHAVALSVHAVWPRCQPTPSRCQSTPSLSTHTIWPRCQPTLSRCQSTPSRCHSTP